MRENNVSKNMSRLELLNPQGVLICPVCGKEFKADENTMYIANGGYVCDWKKCFMKVAWEKSEERKELKK